MTSVGIIAAVEMPRVQNFKQSVGLLNLSKDSASGLDV